jgi:hypothetical protein
VASPYPVFFNPSSSTGLKNENNVTCSYVNYNLLLVPDPGTTVYDLLSINSGCTGCVTNSGIITCTCTPTYDNIKGVSYNLACATYGKHFGSYIKYQGLYPKYCDNVINAINPIAGLYDILLN